MAATGALGPIPVLDALEQRLCVAGGDFTDSTVILDRLTGVLRLCLEALARGDADLASIVAEVRDAGLSGAAVLHPLVRMEIARQLAARSGRGPAVAGDALRVKLSAVAERGRTAEGWSPLLVDPSAQNAIEPSLAQTTGALYANERDQGVRVGVPPAHAARAIDAAATVLDDVVPRMWRTTRDHTFAIVFLEGAPFASVSFYGLPGTTMLSTALLDDQDALANALLHEGLHHKFHDLWSHWSIVPGGFNPESLPRLVRPPWRADLEDRDAAWTVDIAISAAHVYVHTIVFDGRLGNVSDPAEPYASAAARAEYLVGPAFDEVVAYLGPKGQQFCAWLRTCFEDWKGAAAA